jgi:hypothetical protein
MLDLLGGRCDNAASFPKEVTMHRLMLAWALAQMDPSTAEEIAAEADQRRQEGYDPGSALQAWARDFLQRNAETIRGLR